jgi:hypothetical protein
MLLKRAQRGQLPLVDAVKKLQAELLGGPPSASDLVGNAKKAGFFALGIAYQKYLAELEHQQEVLASLTDMLMNTFAIESVMLRARKRGGQNAEEMAAVFAREALDTIDAAGRAVLANCSEGDALKMNLTILKRFTKYDPVDAIAIRRRIAARLLEAGRYVV